MSVPSLSAGHPQPFPPAAQPLPLLLQPVFLPGSGAGAFLCLYTYYGVEPKARHHPSPLALISSLILLLLNQGMSPGFPVVTDTPQLSSVCLSHRWSPTPTLLALYC